MKTLKDIQATLKGYAERLDTDDLFIAAANLVEEIGGTSCDATLPQDEHSEEVVRQLLLVFNTSEGQQVLLLATDGALVDIPEEEKDLYRTIFTLGFKQEAPTKH